MHIGSENKAFPAEIKEIVDRTVTGITAVMGNVDDGADIIHKGAFKKTIQENSGRNRIRHLWQHDWQQPPIAAVRDIREVGRADLPPKIKSMFPEASGGLLVERTYLDTPRADEVLSGLRSGAINEMSIGYDPIKFDFEELEGGEAKGLMIRNLRELRLWDTSDVNWGMNAATSGIKSIVPFRSVGVQEKNHLFVTPKDGIEDWHYALADEERKEFLHHNADGKANWLAVKDSMSRLLGADVALTPAERQGVYNHLKQHYAEFDEDAPDYKLVEFGYLVKEAETLTSHADLTKFANEITSIREQLRAEPRPALTQRYRQRIDLLKLELELLED